MCSRLVIKIEVLKGIDMLESREWRIFSKSRRDKEATLISRVIGIIFQSNEGFKDLVHDLVLLVLRP